MGKAPESNGAPAEEPLGARDEKSLHSNWAFAEGLEDANCRRGEQSREKGVQSHVDKTRGEKGAQGQNGEKEFREEFSSLTMHRTGTIPVLFRRGKRRTIRWSILSGRRQKKKQTGHRSAERPFMTQCA